MSDQIKLAGADAIELNIYFVPNDPHVSSYDVEARYLEMVSIVRAAVKIPVAVKIGSQFSNLPNFVRRLAETGANGVVMFNRFLEPDINLSTLQITPQLVLSNRHELRLPLRWIAIVRDQTAMSLAASSGVHFYEDAIKLLLVGADVCMMTSALIKHGVDYIASLLEGYRDPVPWPSALYGWDYRTRETLAANESVRPLAASPARILVGELLP